MVLNIIDKLNEWSEQLKELVTKNDRSPLFYGLIFVVGLAVFAIAYGVLHKDSE